MSLYLGENLISGNTSLAKIEQEIPLGASKYSGETLEQSAGWVKSAGQWNSGSLYSTFYTEAVDNIGSDFAKGKIVASTDTYTDYDLVVNTTAQTFRLPLLDGSEDLPSNKYDDLTLNSSGSTYTALANGWYYFDGGALSGNKWLSLFSNNLAVTGISISGISNTAVILPVKKGDIVTASYSVDTARTFRFIYAQGNGNLYFKVANTVQNLALLDVGQITNALTLKADVDLTNCTDVANIKMAHNAMPSDKYIDLTMGASGTTYVAPADGWVFSGKATGIQYYWFNLVNVTAGIYEGRIGAAAGDVIYCLLPVSKGDIFRTDYTITGSVTVFRFIYANGAESEVS